jgi:Mg2+/Co2+ transporter CorB
MKTLATIVGIGHVISAAASLAMGSLAVLTVFALVMATQSASEHPWFAPARNAPADIPTQFKIGMEL